MAHVTFYQIRQNKSRLSARADIYENGSTSTTLGPIVWLDLHIGDETVTVMLPPDRFKEAVQVADLINDLFDPVSNPVSEEA